GGVARQPRKQPGDVACLRTGCGMTPVEALGWGSGGLVMISGLPAVLRNFRATGVPRPSLTRDTLQLAGNMGWIAYGTLAGATPIAAMCALNAVFMSLLIIQQLRSAAGARRTAPDCSGERKYDEKT